MNGILIDTHCHLHDTMSYTKMLAERKKTDPLEYTAERMLTKAVTASVKKIITVGVDNDNSLLAKEFALGVSPDLPEIFWTYGIHPEYASMDIGAKIDWKKLKGVAKLVAIGEVGLDYHYSEHNRKAQIRLFEEMLDLAIKLELPLSLHVREAFPDFLAVMKNFESMHPVGVVHSFSDTVENLEKCLEMGLYIGVNGLTTFADIPLPPLGRMLLETDSPYLAPRPYRGKINQPAYVQQVAEWLSVKLNQPLSEVAKITTKNAENLFKI